MSSHASSEDCPCCHERMAPGDDTDRALVAAFIAGIIARDDNVPIAEALCAKHAAFARSCLEFMQDVGRELSRRRRAGRATS